MSETRDKGLETAFKEMCVAASATDNCPSSEQLWEAVQGNLAGSEVASIAEHMASCGACAEDWRVSAELAKTMESNKSTTAPGKLIIFPIRRWLMPMLVAAAVLAAAILVPRSRQAHPLVNVRNEQGLAVITNILDPDALLSRKDCVLRWQLNPAESGSVFSVQVTTTDIFKVITHVDDLAEAKLKLDPSLLADLPVSTSLLWRVEVTYPDGRVMRSATFTQPLTDP